MFLERDDVTCVGGEHSALEETCGINEKKYEMAGGGTCSHNVLIKTYLG